MSSSATGAARVASVERQLVTLGYRFIRSSASGRAGSAERRRHRVAGDLVAFAPADSRLPHLVVEVGGAGKRIGVALAELTEQPLPAGFTAIVAICAKGRWRFYVDVDSRHDSLSDAIDASRDR